MAGNVSIVTPSDCLKLLQEFLPQEFNGLDVDDIDVSVQQGGLINTLKLITNRKTNYRVLIRHYGGNVLDLGFFRSLLSPLIWQVIYVINWRVLLAN